MNINDNIFGSDEKRLRTYQDIQNEYIKNREKYLRQRKLEERKLEENKRQKQLYYSQLQNKYSSIGATMIWREFENGYTIITNEKIAITELFKLLDDKWEFECIINDLNNQKIVTIDYGWSLYFKEEDEVKRFKKGNTKKQAENYLFCYLENRKIKRFEESLDNILSTELKQPSELRIVTDSFEEKAILILEKSPYSINLKKHIECSKDNDMIVVEYELPNMSIFPTVKEYKYIASTNDISAKKYTESYLSKRYETAIYSIILRSISEVFSIDTKNEIQSITFNGFVTAINPATGNNERKCIVSIQVTKDKFSQISLSYVEPKACFKALKGVSAAKLIDISPVTPILTFNKKDKRFVEGKDITINQGTNLAAMHWEDFEHLVRELFEMEFARNGGEVHVTQASRDGGVDAVVFDPDPLRGGKIVIQAKRYTNTVGVSAVRDLYGTVINEGANTGILITTSDYGHDSYEFAKDKPLKLLNGGHLLALLQRNGRKAHIDIEEAKKIITNKNNS